jgi:hypothetical protein
MKKIVLVVTLRTVQSLEKRIQDLGNILDLLDSTNDTLNGMKTLSKDTTWGKIFETIRRHAVSLHSAIKNGWNCDCEVTHLAGLQLQRRQITQTSPRFTMNFALPQSEPNLSNHRRRLLIYAKKRKEGPARKRLDSAPVQETYITQLRANFGTESLPEVNATTLPIRFGLHSPYSSTSSGFGFGGIFIKSALSILTTANISIPSETEVLVDEQSTWVYCKATRQLSWPCIKALQKMASYAKV